MARDENWVILPPEDPVVTPAPARVDQLSVHVNDDNTVTFSYELASLILRIFGYELSSGGS